MNIGPKVWYEFLKIKTSYLWKTIQKCLALLQIYQLIFHSYVCFIFSELYLVPLLYHPFWC